MKIKTTVTLLSILIIILYGGCRTFTSPAREHELENNTSYWIDYDATRRGAIVDVDSAGNTRMLSEPSPDAAIEMTQKYMSKIDYKEIGAEGTLDVTEQIVQLGKRTTTIMFLRESLYRLAELSSADQLNSDTKELFQIALEVSLKLANAELTQSEASLERARARVLDKAEKLKEMGLSDDDLNDILD